MVVRAIARLKRAAATRDPNRIAEIVHIPFNFAHRDDRQIRITSREQFLRLFPQIFNEDTYRGIERMSFGDAIVIDPTTQALAFYQGACGSSQTRRAENRSSTRSITNGSMSRCARVRADAFCHSLAACL